MAARGRPRKDSYIDPNVNYIKDDVLTLEQEKLYLPHRHGAPFYKWQHDFFHSTNKNAFICSANQIGKSSVLIRKIIELATNTDLWPKLWRQQPTQFWYFYPNKDMATIEFEEKWVKEHLPRKELKFHPRYGWRANIEYKKIHDVKFNSGVTVYFKSYEQNISAIQASTVFFVGVDEELPAHFYPQINARRFGCDGYFNSVFTATIGQRFWYDTIERIGEADERFPKAFKRQVSMYDCLKYYKSKEKTPWTKKRIKEVIESCENEQEVLRCVYGKFILDRNILYNQFDKKTHFIDKAIGIPTYSHFLAVFIGKDNISSVAHFAISEDRHKVYLLDYFQKAMTPIDLFLEIRRKKSKQKFVAQFINTDANDFIQIAQSAGEFFVQTKLSEDGAEKLVNSLFRTKSYFIKKNDVSDQLSFQLESIKIKAASTYQTYELIGAMVTGFENLKFDFKRIIDGMEEKVDPNANMDERLRHYKGLDRDDLVQSDTLEAQYQDLNESLEFGIEGSLNEIF